MNVKDPTKAMPPLPDKDQIQLDALGLRGFSLSTRYALCWYKRHGTHVRKHYRDDYDLWVCLEHGVMWRTLPKQEKKRRTR